MGVSSYMTPPPRPLEDAEVLVGNKWDFTNLGNIWTFKYTTMTIVYLCTPDPPTETLLLDLIILHLIGSHVGVNHDRVTVDTRIPNKKSPPSPLIPMFCSKEVHVFQVQFWPQLVQQKEAYLDLCIALDM